MSINLESNILSWTERLRSDKYRLASLAAAFVKTLFSYNYPHYYRSASLAAAFVFSCCWSLAPLPLCTNRGRLIIGLVKFWMLMFDVYAWLSVKSSFEGLCLMFMQLYQDDSRRRPTWGAPSQKHHITVSKIWIPWEALKKEPLTCVSAFQIPCKALSKSHLLHGLLFWAPCLALKKSNILKCRFQFRSDWNIVTRLYRGPLLVIILIGSLALIMWKIENLIEWIFQKNRVTWSQHQRMGEVRSEPRPHLRTRPKASFIAPAGCFYKSDSRWNLPFNLYLRNDGHFGAFVICLMGTYACK